MNSALNFLLAQLPNQGQAEVDLGPVPMIIGVIELVLAVIIIAGMWKVYTKAGEPGWAVIVPFYNIYVLLKIVDRPWWWLLLILIPCVGIVIFIIVYNDLAKSFGQGVGFTIGLILLPFVFFPILGFGDARYQPIKRNIAPSY